MKPLFLFLPPVVALLGALWPALWAHAGSDEQRIRQLQSRGEILSLEQIYARARAVKSGRVVDVDVDDDRGRLVYDIELLDTQGKVWEMEFDARTGRMLKLEQDD